MTATTPTTLPGYDEALALLLRYAPALPEEEVDLGEALGRTLRRAVVADRDQPPFHRSAMDGFAIRTAEYARGHLYGVTGSVAAGQTDWQELSNRAGVLRIATGAPVPDGFDAVIPIERASVSTDHGTEQVMFELDEVKPWQSIHRRATDAHAGDVVIEPDMRLGPQHIGIAAAVGAKRLTVAARPRITLLTSGDEVRPCETETATLEPQQIRNSNGPMLRALLAALGAPLLNHVHVPDEPEQTLAAAREALSHSHIVVTVGGVSVGQRDLLPWAWQKLGLGTVLHGVAIQPGKPLLVCSDAKENAEGEMRNAESQQSNEPRASEHSALRIPNSEFAPTKLVLGLPGTPVSVLATANLFLRALLLRMFAGNAARDAGLPWRAVRLAEAVRAKRSRQVFRAAKLNGDGTATVIQWHGSGDLIHTAGADGFVRLPLQDEPAAAGSEVAFLALP